MTMVPACQPCCHLLLRAPCLRDRGLTWHVEQVSGDRDDGRPSADKCWIPTWSSSEGFADSARVHRVLTLVRCYDI